MQMLVGILCGFALFPTFANSQLYSPDALSSGRHLLSENEKFSNESSTNATIIKVNDCSLIYVKDIVVSQKKADNVRAFEVSLPRITQPGDGSFCSNTSANSTLVAEWNNKTLPSPLTKFKLTMKFIQVSGARSWKLLSTHVTMMCGDSVSCTSLEDEAFPASSLSDIAAPIKMSYHCNDLVLATKNISISFKKMQVQPFHLKDNAKFGDAADCVGFFSIGVLSSLFVTLILLGILAFGIVMLADISTMDRFDDPKGKGLQVNTAGSD